MIETINIQSSVPVYEQIENHVLQPLRAFAKDPRELVEFRLRDERFGPTVRDVDLMSRDRRRRAAVQLAVFLAVRTH